MPNYLGAPVGAPFEFAYEKIVTDRKLVLQ